MIDTVLAFVADFEQQPLWVQIWVNFLGLVNFAAVFFLHSKMARYVLAAIIIAVIALLALYSQVGYVRLLGLPHIIVWTPMLVYFWKAVPRLEAGKLKKFLYLVMATDFISLAFDYVDVGRYFFGNI